jgi:hypothetical protein
MDAVARGPLSLAKSVPRTEKSGIRGGEVRGRVASPVEEEFPALCRWRGEYTSHEAVKACVPSREQIVAFYAGMKERLALLAKSMQK